MIRHLPIVFAVALVGCAGVTPATKTNATIDFCNSAAQTLRLLTVRRQAGKLTPDDVTKVHDAEKLLDPICKAPAPPSDPVAAVAAANVALQTLITAELGSR